MAYFVRFPVSVASTTAVIVLYPSRVSEPELEFIGQNAVAASGTNTYSPLPVYVDAEDRSAMEWTKSETAADAQFAVVGGAGEWFPYLTNRTPVIVKYGTEWLGQETFRRHELAQEQLRECWNATCMNATLVRHDFASEVDYLYVPYGAFMSGRSSATISPALHESLLASEQFTQVYRNEGVGVYEYNRTAAVVREMRQEIGKE